MTDTAWRCADLVPDSLADHLHFFDHVAFTDNPRWAGCYCFYPLHDPQVIRWQDRLGADNRADMQQSVAAGQARGVLAYRGDSPVGFCHAAPWSHFPMLRDTAPADAATTGVIFCFVVAPAARGQGVATALLQAACDSLRRQGMRSVIARPLRDAQGDAANHLGPLSMYVRAGFTVEDDGRGDQITVRKRLRPD